MQNPIYKFIRLLIGAAFFLVSCALFTPGYTTPQWAGILPAGSSGYCIINDFNRQEFLLSFITEKILPQNDEIKKLLLSTKKFMGAFTLTDNPEQKTGFTIALVGEYPHFLTNFALAWNAEWEHIKEPVDYYVHRESSLKVSNPNSFLILLTNEQILPALKKIRKPGTLALSQEVPEKSPNSNLFLYFPSFTDTILPESIPFNKTRMPIEESWIESRISEKTVTLSGGFNLKEANKANKFLKSFKLFLLWLLREAKVDNLNRKIREVEIFTRENFLHFNTLTYSLNEFEETTAIFTEGALTF